MATNWPPPPGTYPAWPPAPYTRLEFSDIKTGIRFLQSEGWTRSNPTSQENRTFFKDVLCDEGHSTSGTMLVSPSGIRYPFAYCVGAVHKSALVLWIVGYDSLGNPCYDLGWNSGVLV